MWVAWVYLFLASGGQARGLGEEKILQLSDGQRPPSMSISDALSSKELQKNNNEGGDVQLLQFLLPQRQRRSLPDNECRNKTLSIGSSATYMEDSIYGGNYIDNMNCLWTLTAPNADDRILLMSLDFLLEDSYDCRYDYVEIFDGEFQPSDSIGKLCGRKDVRLISRTRQLIVHFRTDSSVTALGFRFEITKLVSSNAVCNKTYENTQGTILSPDYGLDSYYPNNLTCLYSIKAPASKKVRLQFDDFVLEEGSCIDDYLTVYDGKTSGSNEVGTYCGRGNPKSITSSTGDMLLFFHTNSFIRNRGFKLTYTFVDGTFEIEPGITPPEYDPDCSPTISREGQSVTSPHFSDGDYYLQRRKCRTVLVPPQGHGVMVRFRKFDLEESLDCIYDHVNVTYNVKTGVTKKVRLCGYQRRNTQCFYSSNGNITLDFKSDVLFEGSGYEAEYRFVAPNETDDVDCDELSCDDECQGYCYNNGGDFSCACPIGKVPPRCFHNVSWTEPMPDKTTVYEGTTLELSCSVNHMHTITLWDSNFFMLPNATKSHIIVKEDKLKITSALVTDSGLYTCTVQAGEMLLSQTVNVTVKPEEEYCGIASPAIINPNSNAAVATIAGKNSSKATDFIPWQVHLWDRSKESHHCGGVLISERHVLTAAHCVKGSKAAGFKPNNIRVSIGTLSCRKADAVSRNVARYMTHPRYNFRTLEYDFALLELDRAVNEKSKKIYPICLTQSAEIWNNVHVGYKGVIAGCGKNKNDVPDVLHMTTVPIVNRTICRRNQKGKPFTEDMFCAGHKEQDIGDACEGDSGGGIAAKIKGRWTLLGLISFGSGCARKGHYGFYANVTHAMDWIREVAPTCGRTRFIKGNHEAGLILHGDRALPKQFPWAGILMLNNHIHCSVTVISTKWVVSARHCVERFASKIKNMRVVLGTLTASKTVAGIGRRNMRVQELRFEDDGPDVALLKLQENLDSFTDFIQPACLPGADENITDNETGIVSGWGYHDLTEPNLSDNLLYGEFTKTDKVPCEFKAAFSTDICLTSTVNATIKAYKGDSGAGFVTEKHGRHILSAVYKSGNRRSAVGAYSEIPGIVPWIKKELGWIEGEE